MQRDSKGSDDPALWSSLLSSVEGVLLDVPRLQPREGVDLDRSTMAKMEPLVGAALGIQVEDVFTRTGGCGCDLMGLTAST